MQIEAAFSLSEEYYKFMSDFAQTSFEDDKLLGKFYTDFTVAKRMVETIVENVKLDVFSRDIKLIDPFCGDGRLISETIIQLIQKDIIHGRKLYISLWDIDEVAVNVAKQNVEEICNAYQLSYEIDAKKYDAFVGYQLIKGHYDICVTNPPWSLLKPQKLFNKSNNEEALEAYRVAIEKYDGFMKSEFPISQPSRKFGKWGTNLARCGTEVALRTIKFRVARNTWSDEIEKWDHLHNLTFAIAVGSEKERLEALRKQADITMINRENLQWLIEKSGQPFEYDMVVIDELSSFKNHQAKRFKALMKERHKVKRIVGLTGTPSSNGLMDLFAEFKILDISFTVRYCRALSDIDSTKCRVLFDGAVYNIVSIDHMNFKKKCLKFKCEKERKK